jgi:soluble lytic murein transglycosylase-like protein
MTGLALVLVCLVTGCAREAWVTVNWPVGDYPGPLPDRLQVATTTASGPDGLARLSMPLVPRWAADAGMPYAEAVQRASVQYQLPQPLIWAVIKAESNFQSGAVSPAGAEGLMQLMPRTADAMGVDDSFDPVQNIFGGARYLRYLANRFEGDLRLTVAGYNAGPGAVKRHGGIPPYTETQNYVRRVLYFYFGSAAQPMAQALR